MSESLLRLEELFAEARERPPAERRRFVAEACGDDAELRRELEELLVADKQAVGWFEELAGGIAAAADVELESAARPRVRIGPYRTLEVIGRGGMGVVYRAERVDGQFEQQVALKLLHLDMETPELQVRFMAERQLLARLSHPHIAHLLDGGVTDEGRPYIVMEHVEGVPIDRYCRERELTVRETLRLFLQVVEAVSYLHRNLVVHRDLKPGNIFVDGEGQVKLLDFGIAKLLADDSALPGRTLTGEQLLTPEYAAPEQRAGASVTTATDVYALGCVLFELLTGRRPFREAAGDLEEVLHRVPTAPSSVLRGHSANGDGGGEGLRRLSWRRLKGDLDTICLEALRPEPELRYPSAEQMGQDIRRHLERLPVRARKATLGYRLGKFARRHQQGVAVALLLVALAAIGFARERGLRGAAEQARLAADREAAKAVAVSDFLGGLLSSADPAVARGEELTVAEVLDQASARLDESADFAGQPAVEASVRRIVGDTYQALSRFEESKAHLDRAVALSGGLGSTTDEALAAIASLGRLHMRRGEFPRAEALARHVLEARSATLGDHDPATLTALTELANALWAQGLYDQVEPLDRRTLEARRRLLGEDHPDTLRSMNGLAATLFSTARYLEAAELFERTRDAQRRVLGEDHPDTLTAANNLAACYMELCYYRRAEQVLLQVLEGRLRVLGEEDPMTWTTQHNLGTVIAAQARYEEAEEHLRQAAGKREGLAGDRSDYHFTRSYLADALRDSGRHAEAESIYLETLAEQRRRFGAGDAQTLKTLSGLALLRLRQDRLVEAERLAQEVVQRMPEAVNDQHPDLLGGRVLLARVRNVQGRHAEALELSEDVLAGAGPAYDAGHPLRLEAEFERALALRGLGRVEEAAELASGTYQRRVSRLGGRHPRTLEAHRLVNELGASASG